MSFEVLGPAGRDPEILVHAARMQERYQAAAATLLERLLIEGAPHGVCIEDIERLLMLEKLPDGRSPTFIREVVVELIICLRPK